MLLSQEYTNINHAINCLNKCCNDLKLNFEKYKIKFNRKFFNKKLINIMGKQTHKNIIQENNLEILFNLIFEDKKKAN